MKKRLSALVLFTLTLAVFFAGCNRAPAESAIKNTASASAAAAASTETSSAKSEKEPSGASIDHAISWAQSQIGNETFPYADGDGSCKSYYMCAMFVANAYGSVTSFYGSAYIMWTSVSQHQGDLDAPRGSLVFFDRNDSNDGLGHVALCTGDGKIIEAGHSLVRSGTISDDAKDSKYLGWAWPPPYWHNESRGTGS